MVVEAKAPSAAVAALMTDFSVEVTARDSKAIDACATELPKGTEVYVAFIPGEKIDRMVEAAKALRKGGLEPVPHVVARNIADNAELNDYLSRLKSEAGVTRALALAGDVDEPTGQFQGAVDILQTGLFGKNGISNVGISWYPEPHKKIPPDVMVRDRKAKLAACAEQGVSPWLVSQFAFEAQPYLDTIAEIRAQGVTAPIKVGVAGPADKKVLFRFAMVCGVGNSIRALGAHGEQTVGLMTRQSPDEVLVDIAKAQAERPELGVAGVHVFTFGGIAGTARWARELTGRA